jgi:hypothetical protein
MVSGRSSDVDGRDAVTKYYLALTSVHQGVESQGLPASISVLGLSWPTRWFRTSFVETTLIAELLFALPKSCGTLAICRNSHVRDGEFESLASRDLSVILPAVRGMRGSIQKAPVFAVRQNHRRTFAYLLESFWCVGDGHWLFVDWPEPGTEIVQRIDSIRSEASHQRMEEKGRSLLVQSSVFGITYDDCMVNFYVRAAPDEVREVLTIVAKQCGVTLVCE